jgi:hypothetical protein
MQHIFQHTQAAVKIKLHGCYKFGDGGRSWSQILLRLFKNSDCCAKPEQPSFGVRKYIYICTKAIFEIVLLTSVVVPSVKSFAFAHGVRARCFPVTWFPISYALKQFLGGRYSQLLSTTAIICASIGRLRLKIDFGGCFFVQSHFCGTCSYLF